MGSLIFVAACGIFSYGMQTLSCGIWNQVSLPGIEARPSAMGVQSLSHWTTREVPIMAYTYYGHYGHGYMCENYQNIYENAALQASDSKVSAISRSL